jgi:hypothetical protein
MTPDQIAQFIAGARADLKWYDDNALDGHCEEEVADYENNLICAILPDALDLLEDLNLKYEVMLKVRAEYVSEGLRPKLPGNLFKSHFSTCPHADQHRRK